jgi:long-subunit acyl-CoA synthetase (AMP-forming)
LFAPKYIENKLKFFPNIKEAVAFGDGRDFVAVFLNIDLTSVGNWAERNNVPTPPTRNWRQPAGLRDDARATSSR